MYVNDDLIFLELQKTGGSHILRLLDMLYGGNIIGKHNRLSAENIGERFVFGSIRNPWDWYVSLWAYGVGNKGAIRYRTTKGVDLNYYYADLPHDMGKNWLSPKELVLSFRNDLNKPTDQWYATYHDSASAENFRTWLKMLLNYDYRFDVGEGYAFSPIASHSGLMTYRYFRLFTLGNKLFSEQKLSVKNAIHDFDEKYSISKGMIRMENLEEDFISVILKSKGALADEQIKNINSQKKTNISKRKAFEYYYDNETIELVRNKEDFLIEKYNYSAPVL